MPPVDKVVFAALTPETIALGTVFYDRMYTEVCRYYTDKGHEEQFEIFTQIYESFGEINQP